MTSEEALNAARAEIGTKENPPGSNNVKYNTWYYGKSVSGSAYPWCCVYIAWLFRGTNLVPKTALCLNMLQWFESRGQVVKDPKPGDLVFFKFPTSTRRTNHIGIVESVNGKIINTIEGNTSLTSDDNGGAVMRRRRTNNIVAYVRPKYLESRGKTMEEIAIEVIDGKWGNGAERKRRLITAGYNFVEIQKIVNEIVGAKKNG